MAGRQWRIQGAVVFAIGKNRKTLLVLLCVSTSGQRKEKIWPPLWNPKYATVATAAKHAIQYQKIALENQDLPCAPYAPRITANTPEIPAIRINTRPGSAPRR